MTEISNVNSVTPDFIDQLNQNFAAFDAALDGLTNEVRDVTHGGTGVTGFGVVSAKTASGTLTAGESYQTITNAGASGPVIQTLPAPAAGLEFTAAVVASQTLILDVTGSVVIALGPGIESTAGGQISANEPGAFVTLKCLSATRWQAIAGGNGWTPS